MALATDSVWQLFAFSGIASCTAELATVPIDVVKTRMQLQGELGSVKRYSSSLSAFPTIVRQEGFFALYKGVQPALLRQGTYGSVRIGLYEPIKARVNALVTGTAGATSSSAADAGAPAAPVSILTKLLSGVLSGAVASGVFTPTDVVKVRMQADTGGGGAVGPDGKPTPPRYRNVLHALATIGRTEGVRGLYNGVSPTMQRAAVVAAVELASYDECKQLLVSLGLPESGAATHLTSSILAGFLCTLASSPLDVVKSRVMSQPVDPVTGRGTRYSSTLDCFRKSVAAEGVASLWKGFGPNFGRIGPHCVITFMVIERLRVWAAAGKARREADAAGAAGGVAAR